MRVIPTRVHGALDYLIGAVLVAAPWLFGFSDVGSAKWTAIGVGVAMMATSVMTNYEWGLARLIPMHAHLFADAALGVFLVASPWIFGFADDGTNVWLPHVLVGLGEIGIAAASNPWPNDAEARRREERLAPGVTTR